MSYRYGLEDFRSIAVGAALLGSGGGGSYHDAHNVIAELGDSGWTGTVEVRDYDGATDACVLAMMGSPDAAEDLALADIERAMHNTVDAFGTLCGMTPRCVIPVEIGPINSTVPLIAAALNSQTIAWVVDGDGAGRAVPQLPQTVYGGAAGLAPSPCVLADDAASAGAIRSARIGAASAAEVESLAGSLVNAFGSYAGIMLWPSTRSNGFALKNNYLPGTLEQTRKLGQYLMQGDEKPATQAVVERITAITGRRASAALIQVYITDVKQATSLASLDVGTIRLDDHPDIGQSRNTYFIYNMNENLILYSAQHEAPLVVAPDSICYYAEHTGRGFSNAFDDLAPYYDRANARSTGIALSVIKIDAAPAFRRAAGVVESFTTLLRAIGYGGRVPG
ncbi:DUF917 family protein [uncultured Salinisphaera sp.]|uniref:S-methyl thiohydantoin desulfurase domain-containing protein n=1 Tax=uncultured Salinisphaera sp. TaxID=359372 RepID=UPI0032B1F2F7